VVQEGIRRTRTNQELRELYKDLDILAGIKKEDWNGLAIVRMGKGRTVKVLARKPEGSRRNVRTRLRLLEDMW
jgi:hypothetical protein